MKRYQVVFSKWNGRQGCWTPAVVAQRSTMARAQRLAERIGDHHPDLRVTSATYRRSRSTVEVVDRRRGGRAVWEHPGVVVQSVGELGWSP